VPHSKGCILFLPVLQKDKFRNRISFFPGVAITKKYYSVSPHAENLRKSDQIPYLEGKIKRIASFTPWTNIDV
jgi:hypothetical protein